MEDRSSTEADGGSVLLVRARDSLEATMLVAMLEANGVPARTVGGAAAIGFGELGADAICVDVRVLRSDHARARELLERFYHERNVGTAWTCSACSQENEGVLGLCWSCGASRPAGSESEGVAPEGTAPEGIAPEGTAPEGTAPEGTAPIDDSTTDEAISVAEQVPWRLNNARAFTAILGLYALVWLLLAIADQITPSRSEGAADVRALFLLFAAPIVLGPAFWYAYRWAFRGFDGRRGGPGAR